MADSRLTQSPRAIREGNSDPSNIDSSKVQLGMDNPGKTDAANSGDSNPWQYQGQGGDQKYDAGS